MKRHASLIPLSHDHQHGLALAVMIDRRLRPDEELARKVAAMWEGELRDHFAIEERDVFPLASGERELVERLVGEHRELERLVGEIAAAEDPRAKLEEFGKLLSTHIRSEERRLFEAMQAALSEEEMVELGRKIGDAYDPQACDLT